MALIPRLPPKSSGNTASKSVKTLIPRLTGGRLPTPQPSQSDPLVKDDKGRGVFPIGAGFQQNSQKLAMEAGLGPLRKEVADQLTPGLTAIATANAVKPDIQKPFTAGKAATSVARFIPRVIASVFTDPNRPYTPQSGLTRFLLGADPIVPEETAKQLLTVPQSMLRTVVATIAGDKVWTPQTKEEKLFFGEEPIHPFKQRIESAGDVVSRLRGERKTGLGSLFIGSIGVAGEAVLNTFLDGAAVKGGAKQAAKEAYTTIIEGLAKNAERDLTTDLFQTVARDISEVSKVKNVKARTLALEELKTKYLAPAVADITKIHPDDVKVLEDFLDLAGQGKKTTPAQELDVARLVENYGYDGGKTRASLRNAAEKLIEDSSKVERPLIGSGRTTLGKVGKEATVPEKSLVSTTERQALGSPSGTSPSLSKVSKGDTSLTKNLARSGEDVNPLLTEARNLDKAKQAILESPTLTAQERATVQSAKSFDEVWNIVKTKGPDTQGMFMTRLQTSFENAPKTTTPTNPLLSEARKYKSAELDKIKADTFWGKSLKPTVSEVNVPIDSFGEGKPIGIKQAGTTEKGVQEWMTRIKNGERPAVLVGDGRPAMNQPANVVLDGNHRLEAYRRLGIKEIPIIDNTSSQLTSIWEKANKVKPQQAMGAVAGVRTEQDENGKLKISYDPATGVMGLVGGIVVGQKLPESMYATNRIAEVDGNILKRMIAGGGKAVKTALSDTGKTFDKVLGAISTRLKNIDPSLKSALRTFEFKLANNIQKDRKVADGWLRKISSIPDQEYSDLDLAMKNGDVAKIEAIVERHGLQEEYKNLRKMLDDVYKRAEDVGYDIGYQKDYFPRMVDDSEGLLTYLEKGEDWSIIDGAIKAKETELGRYLTTPEKAKVVNTLIRGYGTGGITLSKTGAMKARAIDVVTPEINKFYKDSTDSLLQYIDGSNNAIEARKFFGKAGKSDEFGNIEDSIGAYTLDLIAKGKITPEQEKTLRSILQARFEPVGTSGAIQVYKNLAYIDTMGSITSAVTQLGDLAFSLYKAGPIETIKSLGRAIIGKSKITRADIGIEKIAQEFESASRSSKLVEKVFKVTGLNYMDALGKETLINSTLSRYRKLAQKPTQEFIDKLKATFGKEDNIMQVIDDLKNGRTTEDVKLLAFNELLDMQPVALSEMPEQYLKGGNGRIFYMLKTFTLKQLDIYRNDVFQLMKTNPKRAISNLVVLSSAMMVMGMTADEIKDIILNRDTKMSDRVVDNVLKLAGFGKFTIYKARQEGLATAAVSTILPPFKFLDAAYKDIAQSNEFSQSETMQSIPLGGKLYYWWAGKGATNTAKKAGKDTGLGLPSLGGDLPSMKDMGLPKLPKLGL